MSRATCHTPLNPGARREGAKASVMANQFWEEEEKQQSSSSSRRSRTPSMTERRMSRFADRGCWSSACSVRDRLDDDDCPLAIIVVGLVLVQEA